MTYNADRQKETQNVVWKLLFSAQTQPIYASRFCSPGCYFMPLTNPRLHSTDLVQFYSYWTITTFYKLCDFFIKIFYLTTSSSSGLHSMFLGKTASWYLHIKATWHFQPKNALPKPRNFCLYYQSGEHCTSEPFKWINFF